jgi:hypothetical protein
MKQKMMKRTRKKATKVLTWKALRILKKIGKIRLKRLPM